MAETKKPIEVLEAKDEKKIEQYNPFKLFQDSPTKETVEQIKKKADDEKNVPAINFMFLVNRDGLKVKDEELVKQDGKVAGDYVKKGAQGGSVLCQLEMAKAMIAGLDKTQDEKQKEETCKTIDKLLTAAKANGAKIASFYSGMKCSRLGEIEDAEKHYVEAAKDGVLEATFALAEIKMARIRSKISQLRNEFDDGMSLIRSYFTASQKALMK